MHSRVITQHSLTKLGRRVSWEFMNTTLQDRRNLEQLDRQDLQSRQLLALNRLLDQILPQNQFYQEKLGDLQRPIESFQSLSQLPETTKSELLGRSDDFARNRTFPLEDYSRFHRTSGTHGRPMIVVDTQADWQWWIDTWQFVLDAAEITPADRVLMAFSFGPFIGFWSANDALAKRKAMVIPAGGLSSRARLELIASSQATAVCCTPSYAVHLSEVAAEEGIDLRQSDVSRIIVAGEPGGSVPSMRKRIEDRWGARVVDHSGATEIGPWGYADAHGDGLFVVESEFIAEFESVETRQPAGEGELSELIITTLGRVGCPLIRYRTGDLVRPRWKSAADPQNQFVFLEGGVLGRADDMMVIRGVNVFPSAIEQILCSFAEVDEYRMTAYKNGAMDAIKVEVEDRLRQPTRIAQALQLGLGLHVVVDLVEAGSLPRFEAKGKRFVDRRKEAIN